MPDVLPVTVAAVSASVTRVRDGQLLPVEDDTLAVEEPLEIRLQWLAQGQQHDEPLTITMRTPGHDRELAAGLLFSEGIIREASQLVQLVAGDNPNTMSAQLAAGHQLDMKKYQRHFYSTSSCGVCGKMAIESLRLLYQPKLPTAVRWLSPGLLMQLPERLRDNQTLFIQTGGVHAAALFSADGELLLLREDVGRHNALDKVLGACLLSGKVSLQDCILLVSGRVGFEIVQKALSANIPVLVAVGAPTSLAVEMAQDAGMTLVGFTRSDGFNCYSGVERLFQDDTAGADHSR